MRGLSRTILLENLRGDRSAVRRKHQQQLDQAEENRVAIAIVAVVFASFVVKKKCSISFLFFVDPPAASATT